MKLTITPAASEWFRTELHVPAGGGVKLFGKVYGNTNVHQGFSQAFQRCDEPVDPVFDQVIDGIHYYVEAFDAWFFDGLDLSIDLDAEYDGPKFTFSHTDGITDTVVWDVDGVSSASYHGE